MMKHVLACVLATLLAVETVRGQGKEAEVRGTPFPEGASGVVSPLMQYLGDELSYSMEHLATEDGTRPYYLGYTIYDEQTAVISATLGAITQDRLHHARNLNIDLRVGDYKVDNTHQIRGGAPAQASGSGNIDLALTDDPISIRHALWYHTDEVFKQATKRLAQIKTDLKVKVEEEDRSDDFTREKAHTYHEAPATLVFDRGGWTKRMREISAIAREYPQVYESNVTVGAYAGTRYIVSSEGTRLQTMEVRYRITLSAETKAEDGMDLDQSSDFNASSPDRLPDDATIEKEFRAVLDQVMALRAAPLAEPYIGPAILRNRASGVFFHEIFGHRIEGHRQKDVTEGQTFTKKLHQQILPEFISVYDDPTLGRIHDTDLRGYYKYDDEGVAAGRVPLVEKGVLQTFLMSRRPLDQNPLSNGHGRRQAGFAPVSRQANLIVESSKQVSFDALRRLLVEECKKQDKPYGLLFEDISGGFTTTSRRGPQSFKVLPIVVYRVFADGRPDELIRGADIVGTPLTAFEKIISTGDDVGVFNGSCGAESGWVPVSAISPSILVSTIEIEKRQRDQSRPPILTAPLDVKP
jgi:predicted Zn-dependent protease